MALLLAALNQGIPGLTAPHAIYVCASEKEEFGLAILEAMAAGLAVVAPTSGGVPTYLTEGETGFLVDTTDQRALAAGIRAAAAVREDPARRSLMTRAQRELIASQYTIDRMANELVCLYQAESDSRLSSVS